MVARNLDVLLLELARNWSGAHTHSLITPFDLLEDTHLTALCCFIESVQVLGQSTSQLRVCLQFQESVSHIKTLAVARHRTMMAVDSPYRSVSAGGLSMKHLSLIAVSETSTLTVRHRTDMRLAYLPNLDSHPHYVLLSSHALGERASILRLNCCLIKRGRQTHHIPYHGPVRSCNEHEDP